MITKLMPWRKAPPKNEFKSPLPNALNPVDMTEQYLAHPPLKQVEASINHRIGQRRRIVQMIPPGSVGAEIGVFTGMFSEFLAKKAQPKRLYLVDPWGSAFGEYYPDWGPYTASGKLKCEACENATRRRAANSPGDIEVVVDTGTNWLKSLPDDVKLDWVYLDAVHKFDAVLADLKDIAPHLSADGIILGDDCWTNRDAKHYGVFRAVQEFCRIAPFEIVRIDHEGQFAIRRRQG